MSDIIRKIRDRFPTYHHTIDLLVAKDPEFAEMCRDYADCLYALSYWSNSQAPEAPARVSEYRALVKDLKIEIAQNLQEAVIRPLD